MSAMDFFENQLQIIKAASNNADGAQIILSGDFNLDESKRFANDYRGKIFFDKLNDLIDDISLIQLINEPTWQRIVNNEIRESVIDHLYVKNPLLINNIEYHEPLIGDHKLISFEINGKNNYSKPIIRRDWSKYSKALLLTALAEETFPIETQNVQDTWNQFENIIINITDKLAPMKTIIPVYKYKKKKPDYNQT